MRRRILSAFICFNFAFTAFLTPGHAQVAVELDLPKPGTMVSTSPAFAPVLLKGLTVHPQNPLQFDFIVDTGDTNMGGEPLKAESLKLVKYFLASLTVPEKDLWVNLSHYEKDRIVPESFGATEMGRDLLAQDYILKQLTASLIYPEKQLGKDFWSRAYKAAREKYGTTNIPFNTFNKVWIIPQKATVYEHNGSAYVVNSHLTVMLEQDYLAMQKNFKGPAAENTNSLGAQAVREILLPEIEREVNTGKNFANLRQAYNSMILAIWYKQNLKQALLNQVYADKDKTVGIDLKDKGAPEKIYARYLEAFKKGVYNYIKDDVDPLTRQTVARKYFSGGMVAPSHVDVKRGDTAVLSPAESAALPRDHAMVVGVDLVGATASGQTKAPITLKRISSALMAQELVDLRKDGKPLGRNYPEWKRSLAEVFARLKEQGENISRVSVEKRDSIIEVLIRRDDYFQSFYRADITAWEKDDAVFEAIESQFEMWRKYMSHKDVDFAMHAGTDQLQVVDWQKLPMWALYVLSYYKSVAGGDRTVEEIIKQGRLRAGPDEVGIFKEGVYDPDNRTYIVPTTGSEADTDQIFIKLLDPSKFEEFKAWKGSLRSKGVEKLALYTTGAIASTMKALSDYGIFDLFNDGSGGYKTITMADIVKHVQSLPESFYHTPNRHYIHGAMRMLNSLGWLTRRGKSTDDNMQFTLTPKGREGLTLVSAYAGVAEFMPESTRLGDYLMGRPGRPLIQGGRTLKQLAALSARGWDMSNKEVIAHLDGFLIIHLAMAMYEEGIFNLFDTGLTLDITRIGGNQDEIRAAFDIFQSAGFVVRNGDAVSLTNEGLVAFDRTLAYGVTVSYDPSYKLAEELLFGDAKNIKRARPDGREALVDRERNVLGSGFAHTTYFRQVDKMVSDSINRKVEAGKIPRPEELSVERPFVLTWADTGSGDGKFLEHIYYVVTRHTKYGQYMKQHPELYKLEMVGVDYNGVAQEVTGKRLTAAGISNFVMFGDINEPFDIVHNVNAGLKEKYGADARLMVIHTRTFLDHNRPWKPVADTAAAEKRQSASTGAYGWRGDAIANNVVEQNQYEHFKAWADALRQEGQDDLMVIELHTIDPEVAAANLTSTLTIPYDLSHLYSDQFTIEHSVYLKAVEDAGFRMHPNAAYHKLFPALEAMATVSIHYFTLNGPEAAPRDNAQLARNPGGINLDPTKLALEIKRDRNGMPLPASQQPIMTMDIDGFTPVIISITPLVSPSF